MTHLTCCLARRKNRPSPSLPPSKTPPYESGEVARVAVDRRSAQCDGGGRCRCCCPSREVRTQTQPCTHIRVVTGIGADAQVQVPTPSPSLRSLILTPASIILIESDGLALADAGCGFDGTSESRERAGVRFDRASGHLRQRVALRACRRVASRPCEHGRCVRANVRSLRRELVRVSAIVPSRRREAVGVAFPCYRWCHGSILPRRIRLRVAVLALGDTGRGACGAVQRIRWVGVCDGDRRRRRRCTEATAARGRLRARLWLRFGVGRMVRIARLRRESAPFPVGGVESTRRT